MLLSRQDKNLDIFVTRPDGSRVVGTKSGDPIMKNSRFLGYSGIFQPNWLSGQPYKPDDLRLSDGMAGGQPALNMVGRYTVQVGLYGASTNKIPYTYTILCKSAACNGKTLFSYHGVAQPGTPQAAGSFELLPP